MLKNLTYNRYMNFRKLMIAAALIVAATSCKDDDDDGTISPSLDGVLSIKGLPEFVLGGTTLTLEPEGVTHPEGEELGYYWKVTPTRPEACTTKVYNITFTDTLQTCTVYCNAFAEGYTGTSLTSYVTVVKGGKDGSIKGIDFPDDNISTADGTYYYKTIGTQTWLVNNVAEKSSGKAYRDEDVMSDVLGRYYNYDEAVAVCDGLSTDGMKWELPTIDDWNTLFDYVAQSKAGAKSVAAALMADATFNGMTMWEYEPLVGDITNGSGFSAIPVGYANLATVTFDGVYEYAAFWSATTADKDNEAYSVCLIFDNPSTSMGARDKGSFGASVRCIRK